MLNLLFFILIFCFFMPPPFLYILCNTKRKCVFTSNVFCCLQIAFYKKNAIFWLFCFACAFTKKKLLKILFLCFNVYSMKKEKKHLPFVPMFGLFNASFSKNCKQTGLWTHLLMKTIRWPGITSWKPAMSLWHRHDSFVYVLLIKRSHDFLFMKYNTIHISVYSITDLFCCIFVLQHPLQLFITAHLQTHPLLRPSTHPQISPLLTQRETPAMPRMK